MCFTTLFQNREKEGKMDYLNSIQSDFSIIPIMQHKIC